MAAEVDLSEAQTAGMCATDAVTTRETAAPPPEPAAALRTVMVLTAAGSEADGTAVAAGDRLERGVTPALLARAKFQAFTRSEANERLCSRNWAASTDPAADEKLRLRVKLVVLLGPDGVGGAGGTGVGAGGVGGTGVGAGAGGTGVGGAGVGGAGVGGAGVGGTGAGGTGVGTGVGISLHVLLQSLGACELARSAAHLPTDESQL